MTVGNNNDNNDNKCATNPTNDQEVMSDNEQVVRVCRTPAVKQLFWDISFVLGAYICIL